MRHLVQLLFQFIAFQAVCAFPVLHNIRAQFSIPPTLSVRVSIHGRNESFTALPISHGPRFSEYTEGYIVHSHENSYGCGETMDLNNRNSTFEGKIVLFNGGQCSYEMKIQNAQTEGAIAVLIEGDNMGSPWQTLFGSGNSPPYVVDGIRARDSDSLRGPSLRRLRIAHIHSRNSIVCQSQH